MVVTRGGKQTKACDSERQKLSSNEFDKYFQQIWNATSQYKRQSFEHLDSLWFGLYHRNANRAKVLGWIKKKNIFSKKYVLIPIVHCSHWSLLILCNFGGKRPCMLLLDSMQAISNGLFLSDIRKFASDIFLTHQRSEHDAADIRKVPIMLPKMPQQTNETDCGFYVLYYIKLFLENAPENFSISNGYPYFLVKDWFTVEDLETFRHQLVNPHEDPNIELLENKGIQQQEIKALEVEVLYNGVPKRNSGSCKRKCSTKSDTSKDNREGPTKHLSSIKVELNEDGTPLGEKRRKINGARTGKIFSRKKCRVGIVSPPRTSEEENNGILKLGEAKAAASRSKEVSVFKRQRAQQLKENADLLSHKAKMAQRIANQLARARKCRITAC